MERNEAQGRAVLARGLAPRAMVDRAWQAAQNGGELLTVLVGWRVVSASDAALIRAELASASSRTLVQPRPPGDGVRAPSSGDFPSVSAPLAGAAKGSIGGHRILGELSRGGMGVVFRARHKSLGEEMALKLLLAEQTEARDRARFEREARAMLKLKHPNIVSFLDYGEDGGRPFLAMELIEGRSLQEVVSEAFRTGSPPSLPWVLEVLRAVARALEAGHGAGVVHRDLKPSNIMIEEGTDRPVVIDYGLARSERLKRKESLSLTGSDDVLGTPSYMAPEQFDAREFGKVGAPADVWGFGGVIFFCLTGRAPFEGPSLSIYKAILGGKRPKLGAVCEPPAWLEEVCEGCFALEPDQRWGFDRVLGELERAGRKKAQVERYRLLTRVFGALLLVSLAGLALALALRPKVVSWDNLPDLPRLTREATLPMTARINAAGSVRAELLKGGKWVRLGEFEAGADGAVEGRIGADGDKSRRLREGENLLRFIITNGEVGNAWETKVFLDVSPPALAFDGAWRDVLPITGERIEVAGAVSDLGPEENKLAVRIGRREVDLEQGRFRALVRPKVGRPLVVEATDLAGNVTRRSLVFVDPKRFEVCRTLQERRVWNQASEELRTEICRLVERELGDRFSFQGFKTYSCGGQTHTVGRYVYRPIGTILHLLPGDVYTMGNPDTKGDHEHVDPLNKANVEYSEASDFLNKLGRISAGSYRHEVPAHEVRVPAFLIAQTELTVREWYLARGERLRPELEGFNDRPITDLVIPDVFAWLEGQQPLRLPSEAEWEYACRAGTTTRYYWGSEMDDAYVHYWKSNLGKRSDYRRGLPGFTANRPVTEHRGFENAFGLRDMCGNVSEICQDLCGDYKVTPRDGSPFLEEVSGNEKRRIRGGGRLLGGAFYARSSFRGALSPIQRRNSVGFRVACGLSGFDPRKE